LDFGYHPLDPKVLISTIHQKRGKVMRDRIIRGLLSRATHSAYTDFGLSSVVHRAPELVAREALHHIRNGGKTAFDLDNVDQFLAFAAPLVPHVSSQLFQDIWTLWETGQKRGGYFVEFGACDGRDLSNTCYLEKEMGWTGIVAEPNPNSSAGLYANRSCFISTKCVYSRSGEKIDFLAARDDVGLSRIASIDPGDHHDRSKYERISVETISLNDLLIEAKAPIDIDFMSVDTEGSEVEILSHFDFSKWRVRCLAVEHNYTSSREKLFKLLTANGFRRKWPGIAYADDWYVRI
jgi:FkbM family methyltransferase